ncbi:hypothetical protein CKO25_10280 [Thiocapsa imhoffii]|uniref:Uncharacterized protein n=1 Tax=Thiocapsa imhoffii TaxID=382777 RepID=A0A9X0WHV8_9GAMM|nr:BPSS1780 family membrane protein [Thiocapsa imhoffii]MBK1645031.1 hypothetical protein [Thiocapsa imhoffii]
MVDRYRILYAGELMPGCTPEEVVPKLAAKFKVAEEVARDLLRSGRGRVLKHGLSSEAASRYEAALNAVGLKVEVEVEVESAATDGEQATREPTTSRATDDTATAGPTRQSQPTSICPKCGADAVAALTGVCQACGLVVDHYLAHQPPGATTAADGDAISHLYAPPQADLTPPVPADTTDDPLRAPRARPVGQGWMWIAAAWPLFKAQPLAWIGAIVLFYIIIVMLSFLPLLGSVLVTIGTPMLSAGLMMGAHRQASGERFAISDLFRGLSTRAGPLALVGLLYLAFTLGILLLMVVLFLGIVMAISSAPLNLAELDLEQLDLILSEPLMLLPILIALLFAIPLAMAVFFAPSLVALDQVPVLRSFSLSFFGCLKNILPFLLYGLAAILLMILGSLPILLGLLIVLPLLTISVYTAYWDIYHGS